MTRVCATGLALVLSSMAFGQSFEVASVKLNEDRRSRPVISTSGPRFTAEAKLLVPLLMYAYNLRSYQIARTPALAALDDARYDVVARAGGDAIPTTDQFRQMLQALLAERFQLKAHRESREMPVYVLAVGKGGPKFKESAPDAEPAEHYAASGHNYVVTMPKATMADVLTAIENSLLDRPVVDHTDLKGTYDIRMSYAPDLPSRRQAEPDPQDISIFTAVETLGLRLVPQKAMVDMLIVDHAEKPSGN